MKKLLLALLIMTYNTLYSSNFEIKIALNINDCVSCSEYLYNLNKVSGKYKISLIISREISEESGYVAENIIRKKIANYNVEVSDSLYQIYALKSQNYVSVYKTNEYLLGFQIKDIGSYVDTLNILSFEDGDTINIGYMPETRNKSKVIRDKLYLLNPKRNTLFITNLTFQASTKFQPANYLISEIFNKHFENGPYKLLEIREYYKTINEQHTLKINSFDVDSNNLYLFVDIPYIEKIDRNYLDTFISHISCLLVYKNGEKKPKVLNFHSDFTSKEYDFSSHQLTVIDGEALIHVFLKDKKYYTTNTFWLCKCKLKEEMEFIPENCIKRPKIHTKLNLDAHFNEYLLSGDYLINTMTNELINHRTKSTTDLNLPIQKITFDENDMSKNSIPFVLYDMKILGNEAQIIYSLNTTYYYMKLNLLTNKQIENYVLFEDSRTLNGPPKLFLNNMIYYFPKNAHYLILKNLKSKI